jgi:N-acetylneuraminic acid mutarotase
MMSNGSRLIWVLTSLVLVGCSDKKDGAPAAACSTTAQQKLLLSYHYSPLSLTEPGCNETLVESTKGKLEEGDKKTAPPEEKPAEEPVVPAAAVTPPIVIPDLGAFAIIAPAAAATTSDPNQIITFGTSENAAAISAELCGPAACEQFSLDPSLHKNGKYLPTLQNGQYTLKLTAMGAFGQLKDASNTGLEFTVAIPTSGLGTWEPFDPFGVISPRSDSAAFWSPAQGKMIVWGGADVKAALNTGGLFDSTTKVWTATNTVDAPGGRVSSVAYANTLTLAGTPNRPGALFVWGGSNYHNSATENVSAVYGDGKIYDLAANSWTAISATGAPTARWRHSALWAPDAINKFLVWGGITAPLVKDLTEFSNQGYRYDPDTQTWTPMTTVGAPQARTFQAAVWTGTKMLIWGGLGVVDGKLATLNSGGRYDPAADTWTPISLTGAPSARYGFSYVWTGTYLIVWSGVDQNVLTDGFKYNPADDTWQPIATANAPAPNFGPNTAVMTDTGKMIVWGGLNAADSFFYNTGAIYDIVGNSWTKMALPLAPKGRYGHAAVWNTVADKLIIFGGDNIVGAQGTNSSILGDGGIFSP